MEFSLDGTMSLKEAHDIADMIHDEIEDKVPAVKHCMVHVNPAEQE